MSWATKLKLKCSRYISMYLKVSILSLLLYLYGILMVSNLVYNLYQADLIVMGQFWYRKSSSSSSRNHKLYLNYIELIFVLQHGTLRCTILKLFFFSSVHKCTIYWQVSNCYMRVRKSTILPIGWVKTWPW